MEIVKDNKRNRLSDEDYFFSEEEEIEEETAKTEENYEVKLTELRQLKCPDCLNSMWVETIDIIEDGEEFYITWKCKCGQELNEIYRRIEIE